MLGINRLEVNFLFVIGDLFDFDVFSHLSICFLSYVCPSLVRTGSFMMFSDIGQRNSFGIGSSLCGLYNGLVVIL